MINPNKITVRFFKVIVNGQAYLNLIYLLATFPLGVFYFIFPVFGPSIGISLSIIRVGIPILFVVGASWWVLARFERLMVIHWLKEEVNYMILPQNTMLPTDSRKNIRGYFKEYIYSTR